MNEEPSNQSLVSPSAKGKRTLAVVLAFALLAAITFVGIAFLITRGMPDDARSELARYLVYRYASVPMPTIREAHAAAHAWALKPELSSASYSDTIHYATTAYFNPSTGFNGDASYNGIAASFDPNTAASIATTHDRLAGNRNSYNQWRSDRPLPYPPNEVWCVRLNSAEPGAEVVLVALHVNLYNAAWVVHELPSAGSVAARNAVLAEFDCGITLDD